MIVSLGDDFVQLLPRLAADRVRGFNGSVKGDDVKLLVVSQSVTDDRLDSRPFSEGQIANVVQEFIHTCIIPRADAFEISVPTSL
jgi:hypothetical protein